MEFTDSKDINCFLNSNYENKSLLCSLVCSKLARVASVSMRCRGTRNESQRPRENSDFGSQATSRNRGSFSKQGPEKPGYSRISVHIICLISYAFLSFSDQANPNIEEVNNFSYLLKFDPDIPNSLRGIIVDKLETLQRKYALINGFVTQQFRSFRWLLFPL